MHIGWTQRDGELFDDSIIYRKEEGQAARKGVELGQLRAVNVNERRLVALDFAWESHLGERISVQSHHLCHMVAASTTVTVYLANDLRKAFT